MGATFANSTPRHHPPHLLDFEMNLSTPIPNYTHTHTRACVHAHRLWKNTLQNLQCFLLIANKNKNSAEGVIAPAGAKVTGASIRMWLLNKFISFLAVLTWKTGLKKNVDKVPSGAHIFQASPIPSNGYIFSTDFSYHTAQ